MKFSEKLKELMKAKGLNQSDIANLSGISQTIVSRWLRTDLEPRISNLKPLAKALNVRVIDLLEDYSDENLTETEKTFLALPENKKQMLIDMLRVIDIRYKPEMRIENWKLRIENWELGDKWWVIGDNTKEQMRQHLFDFRAG